MNGFHRESEQAFYGLLIFFKSPYFSGPPHQLFEDAVTIQQN
ncbi:MAG: hypothetical protein Q7R66_11755 [Undibacterium sp.]|nr:hypothetical protein [Undibacterium sp.]